jgi:cobalt-zinc-cadmium efflux system membrane fusion protein
MKTFSICIFLLVVAACSGLPEKPKEAEEKVSEAKEQDKGILEMSEKAQGHIGLKVVSADVRLLTEYLQVTGTVQPIDNKVAHVRSIFPGRLIAVNAKVGDRVAAGDILATFENTEVGEVVSEYQVRRSELDKLNVQLSVARQQSERNRQLADIGAIPRKEYDLSLAEEKSITASIETQEQILSGYRAKLRRMGFEGDSAATSTTGSIRAPFGGIVVRANAAPGETVRPEDELFQIADSSQVWVQAEVYEKDLGRVQSGQMAAVYVDTYADREFLGKVTYISDILDPQTRTARVRCEIANPDGLLKLDMFATVRLPTKFKKDALTVPADAIQQIQGKDIVFVRTGATTFEQKAVRIGRIVQGVAEVLSGLQGGESVVTQGAFHLKSIALGDQIGEEE